MQVQEFSNSEWRDIFDEFRLLVVRAGFAEWDNATAEALDDLNDTDAGKDRSFQQPPVEQLRRYAAEFMHFLKARSRWNLETKRAELGRLLRTEDGAPVHDFSVVFEERRQSLEERADETDAMIDLLNQFLAELHGERTDFWGAAPEGPEGEA